MSVVIDYDQIIQDTEFKFADELKDTVDADFKKYIDNKISAVCVEKTTYYKVMIKTNYTIILALYRKFDNSIPTFIDIEKISLGHYNMIRDFQESGAI